MFESRSIICIRIVLQKDISVCQRAVCMYLCDPSYIRDADLSVDFGAVFDGAL